MSTIPPKSVPDEPEPHGHSFGAGSEAAESIHGVGMTNDPGADTALEGRSTGVGERDGAMRAGSEPLLDRAVEHTSGYGGEGGVPRTSSNEREHVDEDGTLESED